MKHDKIIGIIILALFIGIVVLQNTEIGQTHILLSPFTVPRAVLLFLTALIGFIMGLLSSLSIGRKKSDASL